MAESNFEKILEFLNGKEHLYNIRNEHYKNHKAKHKECEKFGKTLEPPLSGDCILSKIKYIKAQITKTLKHRDDQDSSAREDATWCWYEATKFMHHTVGRKHLQTTPYNRIVRSPEIKYMESISHSLTPTPSTFNELSSTSRQLSPPPSTSHQISPTSHDISLPPTLSTSFRPITTPSVSHQSLTTPLKPHPLSPTSSYQLSPTSSKSRQHSPESLTFDQRSPSPVHSTISRQDEMLKKKIVQGMIRNIEELCKNLDPTEIIDVNVLFSQFLVNVANMNKSQSK